MHWTLQQWRDSSSPGHCSQLQWPETDRMTCWSPRHRRSHRWDRNSSVLEFFCFLCFISTNFYFFLFTLFTVTEISDGSWPSGRQCLSGAATGANSRGQQWRCRLKDHSHSVDQLQAVKGTVFLIHGFHWICIFIVIHFYDLLSETFPGMKKKTQPLPVTAAAPPLTPVNSHLLPVFISSQVQMTSVILNINMSLCLCLHINVVLALNYIRNVVHLL